MRDAKNRKGLFGMLYFVSWWERKNLKKQGEPVPFVSFHLQCRYSAITGLCAPPNFGLKMTGATITNRGAHLSI